ncbi:cell division control protein 42 homolog [Saccostrea echinata]|uniref:cell division control protein 42 homolog n=1 Tax=Saccostrea echinata TaxID=191078 RepID=UPI002A83D9A8|nr:cell division control protein 42 homolog [Saccostrea echinata]
MRSRITCSLVGDAMVGKSRLLASFLGQNIIDMYAPTVFSTLKGIMKVGEKQLKVKFVDTAGQQEYSRLRVLSYKKSDVFILCFSAIDRLSFERIRTLWIPELERNVGKKVPIFLVATHKDLKYDEYVKKCTCIVSTSEGENLAAEIKAEGYFEINTVDSCCARKIFECAMCGVLCNRKGCLRTLRKYFSSRH